MHLSHLYGHKSYKIKKNKKIKTYIFFSFIFLLQTKQRKENFIFLFSFPLLSLFPNIQKRFNFFSFLSYFLSIIHFFSPLFPHVCNQTKHKCPILLYTLSKLRNGCFCFYPLNTLRKSIFPKKQLLLAFNGFSSLGPVCVPLKLES